MSNRAVLAGLTARLAELAKDLKRLGDGLDDHGLIPAASEIGEAEALISVAGLYLSRATECALDPIVETAQ